MLGSLLENLDGELGQIYLRGLVLETFYQRGFLFKLITDGVCYDVDAAIVAGGKACTTIDNCGNKDPAIGNCGTQPKPPVPTAGQERERLYR